jgi:hypothetical protein
VYRFISIERISFTKFQPRHSPRRRSSELSRVVIGDLRVRAAAINRRIARAVFEEMR